MIKVKKRKILLLPGDGIGPEVITEVKKIIEWLNKNKSLDFEIEEALVGGASFEKHKSPITDEVFYKALESEAVILGAVGGPKWDNLEFSKRPERALLKLRKELKLFANLRPAICFKQLVDASTLKPVLLIVFKNCFGIIISVSIFDNDICTGMLFNVVNFSILLKLSYVC